MPSAKRFAIEECDLHGSLWSAPVFHVPCEFQGHAFEILCGAASDKNGASDEEIARVSFPTSFEEFIAWMFLEELHKGC